MAGTIILITRNSKWLQHFRLCGAVDARMTGAPLWETAARSFSGTPHNLTSLSLRTRTLTNNTNTLNEFKLWPIECVSQHIYKHFQDYIWILILSCRSLSLDRGPLSLHAHPTSLPIALATHSALPSYWVSLPHTGYPSPPLYPHVQW